MNNQQPKDITYQKIAWTIRNFSTLKTDARRYSEVFTIGDCNWKIVVCRGTKEDREFLTTHLCVADASSLPPGWSIYADFTFTVVNQSSREESKREDMKCMFFDDTAVLPHRRKFMCLGELEKQSSGFISNDKCIVEVEFYEVKPVRFEPTSHLTYPSSPNESKKVLPENGGGGDGDGMVDFKGLGRIEKPFVPLLEEVFSQYPSLLDCKNSRSREFTEWAFNGLGRVLQFLKEKKLKDMKDEKACEQLQHLWDELEMSKLDFSWLEPDVKSALKMKVYEEKAEKVKKLKKNLKALETHMKELMEKVGGTKQTIEMIKKDLENAVIVLEEKDLDA